MSSPEEIEKKSRLKREDAFAIAASLAEAGIYVILEGAARGWRITLRGHTDLIDVCKVLDTFQVGNGEPLHALYRPFGQESGVMIYAGSKP